MKKNYKRNRTFMNQKSRITPIRLGEEVSTAVNYNLLGPPLPGNVQEEFIMDTLNNFPCAIQKEENEPHDKWLLRAHELLISMDYKKQMLVMMQYFAQNEGRLSETRFMLLINEIRRHSFSFFLERQEAVFSGGTLKYVGYGKIEIYVAGSFLQVELMDNIVISFYIAEGDERIERNFSTIINILRGYGLTASIPSTPNFFILNWSTARKQKSAPYIRLQVPLPQCVNLTYVAREKMESSLETEKRIHLIMSLDSDIENLRAVSDDRNSTIAKYIPDATDFATRLPKYPINQHLISLKENLNVINTPLFRWLSLGSTSTREMTLHLAFLRTTIKDLSIMDIHGKDCAKFQK